MTGTVWGVAFRLVILALGMSVVPTLGRAQEAAVAEALFREGRSAMKTGDYETACAKFEESHRLEASRGALLNLGLCEEQRGRIATAWSKLKLLIDTAPADDERVVLAKERIAALEPDLPRVRISVAEAPEGSVVLLNGVELRSASLGTFIPLDPGSHELVLGAPDGRRSVRRIQITRAERLEVELSLEGRERADAVTARTSPSASDRSADAADARASKATTGERRGDWWTPRRATALALAGTSALGLGVSGYFALSARAKYEVSRDGCDAANRCDPAGMRARDEAFDRARFATIGFVTGAAAGVGAALLWFDDGRAPARSGGLQVVIAANPSATARASEVVVTGRW